MTFSPLSSSDSFERQLQKEEDTQRETLHPLVHSPKLPQQPGQSQEFKAFRVSDVGAGAKRIEHFLLLSGGSWIESEAISYPTSTGIGCQCLS